MNRLRKIVRSALSAVLIAGVVLSSSAIAPMTVTPAEAISPISVVKKGFGALGSLASAVGPTIVGKILNATGNTELANFFGLNTNMNLMTVMEDVQEIQTQLKSVQEQVDDLESQLTSMEQQLQSWDTLTSFFNAHGTLITNCNTNLDVVQRLAQRQMENPVADESYQRDVNQLMNELFLNGNFRTQVLAMGEAIMGRGTGSMGGPTEAYYTNVKQINGLTRDEIMERYMAFTTSLYKDYVTAVVLANGAMAYLADQSGSSTLYETWIAKVSEQAKEVEAFLINERETLFPSTSIDGYNNGGALPDAHLTANDYVATYENGTVKELTKKSESEELQLSEYYLTLEVGEASAVKVFKDGQHYGEWTSSDESVAVVDEFGGVFATGVGTAELTVEYDNEQLSVQVDVVDVSSDSTSITTKTGKEKEINGTDSVALSELMSEAGINGVNPDAYTWITTDPNGVTVNNGIVTGAGKSGGYSMVIGTRQVRYDTNGGSYYEIEKVVFPFETSYGTDGKVYDYDDLLYRDKTDNATVTLQSNLTTDTAYGKIMADTKLNPGLSKMTINGNYHSIDLVGVPLMSDMTGSKVSGLTLISSDTMDSGAVVDYLAPTGTIEDCDINLTIEGNRQYLGGAANESQGKIDGVNFFGSITNTFEGKNEVNSIKGREKDCSEIPWEGRYSVQDSGSRNLVESEAVQIETGTGGIVGRQDVNAQYTNNKWQRTNEETGVYNCYGHGSVTGVCNVGGIAGLAVGDWTKYPTRSSTLWSDLDKDKASYDPNAAYVKVYASVSDGTITATASDGTGIAGGVVGYSVMAEIKGASVSATIQRDNKDKDTDKQGRLAGISGVYMPTYARHDNGGGGDPFNKDTGFIMQGVIVKRDKIQKILMNNKHESFFFNSKPYNYFAGLDYSELTKQKESENLLYWFDDTNPGTYVEGFGNDGSASSINNDLSTDIGATLVENTNSTINNGLPIFNTTRVSTTGHTNYTFVMADSYTYGDTIAPTESTGVVKTEYKIDGGEYTASKPVDAGTYTARATFADGRTKEDTFTINKRTVVFANPAETELEYTGNRRTVDSPYISNLLAGDEVTVEVKGNTGTEVDDYTLTVTGLSGADAGNYQLPAETYTMAWSIVISNQKAASIALSMNEQALDSYTLYYNDDERKTLNLEDITVTILDENGNTYYFKDGEAVQWSYDGSGATLSDGVLTAKAAGSGTLTASFDELSANFTVTVAKYAAVETIVQGENAPMVYVNEAYDLGQVPFTATDAEGNPYTLSEEELDSIQWSVSSSQSSAIEASIDENNQLTVTSIGDAQEATIKLDAILTDSVSCYVTLNVRQQPVVASISVTPDTLDLKPDDSITLLDKLTVSCTDQFGDAIESENLTWTSSNDEVVSIRDNSYLNAKKDGTATLTASVGNVVSNAVTVTVAGTPKLTTITISGAPLAMAWGETLDLNTLTVQQLDQYDQPMSNQQEISWSVKNDGNTKASISGTTLSAGTSGKGTVTLKASVSPTMYGSVEIEVGPSVTGLSVSPAMLTDQGGDVTVTLNGERLAAGITVALFDSNGDQVGKAATTSMNGNACTATLDVPENTTENDQTYTVKLSYNGETYEESPNATVTVLAPTEDPVVTALTPDKTSFDSNGGQMIVTITGANLTQAPTVALFKDETMVDGTAVAAQDPENDSTYTATINVPANETETEVTYTVKASLDGETYLESPTATITVAAPEQEPEPEEPSISKIELSNAEFESNGGEVTVNITGENLATAPMVALIDGNHQITTATAQGAEGHYTVTLTVPENTTENDKTYTVKVSLDGTNYLDAPVATLTVAGVEPEPTPDPEPVDPTPTPEPDPEPTPTPTPDPDPGEPDEPSSGVTTDESGDTTVTTAKPEVSTENGTASATISDTMGAEIVEQAKENDSASVVIAPEMDADVTNTAVTLPADTLASLGNDTGADLVIATPVAQVTLPNGGLADLASAGGAITVAASVDDNTVHVNVSANGETLTDIPGGVTLTVPAETTAGTVAVIVHDDGSREVVRKSLAEGDSVRIPLDGSATIEIIDNSRDFADVAEGSWYDDVVAFASSHELFNGTSENTFSPDAGMSRGMLAAVLCNLERGDAAGLSADFGDVSGDAWYAESIAWAAENGIISGYGDGNVGPDDLITREQMAAMLMNYANMLGLDTSARADLSAYSDQASISSWASDTMSWAVAEGIISGMTADTLAPQGTATRAQVAAMLQRFLEA